MLAPTLREGGRKINVFGNFDSKRRTNKQKNGWNKRRQWYRNFSREIQNMLVKTAGRVWLVTVFWIEFKYSWPIKWLLRNKEGLWRQRKLMRNNSIEIIISHIPEIDNNTSLLFHHLGSDVAITKSLLLEMERRNQDKVPSIESIETEMLKRLKIIQCKNIVQSNNGNACFSSITVQSGCITGKCGFDERNRWTALFKRLVLSLIKVKQSSHSVLVQKSQRIWKLIKIRANKDQKSPQGHEKCIITEKMQNFNYIKGQERRGVSPKTSSKCSKRTSGRHLPAWGRWPFCQKSTVF